MSRWQPYPAYKASGVEWLGEIPVHWETRRLKFAAPESGLKLDGKPDELTYLGLENIESGTGRLLLSNQAENVESTVVAFRKGDILFGKLRPYLAKVVHADFAGVGTTELLVLRPKDDVDGGFLFRCLLSKGFIAAVDSLTYGAKMPRANSEQIGNLAVGLPSLAEQRAISNFLDRQTAKIDALITEQRRLIELLRERRAALISHTVTKGLNPDVPLKDLGVEWLGEIPAHWSLSRIGFIARVGNGSTPRRENPDYWQDGDIPWLTSSKIHDNVIHAADEFVTSTAVAKRHLPMVPADSVLVAITGQGKTRGTAALLKFATTISQHLAYLDISDPRITADFLHLYMASQYQRLRWESEGGGSTRAAITCEYLRRFSVIIPPLSEQCAITKYLDCETGKIDAAVAEVERAIAQLEEYRTALIAAAVTGKIKVDE